VFIPTPSIGEVVTFSFESHARREVPVNPKICRIGTDISWENVVFNSIKERKFLGGMYMVKGVKKGVQF
jgi:hypothetical protein